MAEICVIGAGASGMAAAIEAAKRGVSVTIFEKKEQPGKKLAATGNGHCNFTNARIDEASYRTGEPEKLAAFLERYPTDSVLGFFRENGLLYRQRNGGYYPASNQASSVLAVLSARLSALSADLILNADVRSVEKLPDGRFRVETAGETCFFDACILSCGSRSGVRDKNPFRGYAFCAAFGHNIAEPFPALVPLYGHNGCEKDWDGVRVQGTVSLECADGTTFRESGELQLTDDGISGIPVFQLSHFAAEEIRKYGKASLVLDLLPDMERESLAGALREACGDDAFRKLKPEQFLRGWLPKKLILPVIRKAGVMSKKRMGELVPADCDSIAHMIKAFPYEADGSGGYEVSQVTAGGVSLREVTDSFESMLVPGLFITGELLDVDGICGGYNLHFAFASGMEAGKAACVSAEAIAAGYNAENAAEINNIQGGTA